MANTRRSRSRFDTAYPRIGYEVSKDWIRRIQGLDTAYWGFLRVGTTLDIFQNIHILYLQYGVLTFSGYGLVGFIPLWSLKVLDKISEAINGKKEVALSKLSAATIIKEEVDKNIGTLATILVDQKLWSDKDARVIRVAYNTFGVLSETFDKRRALLYYVWIFFSRQEMEHLVLLKNARVAVKELQITRPKIDKLLKYYVMSQTSNIEEPGDEELVVLETQDGNKKKGKETTTRGRRVTRGKGNGVLEVGCLLDASESPLVTSVTTTALSTTFTSASSIPLISTDDYEIVGVDGQEDTGTDGQAVADGNVATFPNVDDVELNIPQ
ncbi:hypothetical protein Tco_0543524 [Tanacetum coccineum]